MVPHYLLTGLLFLVYDNVLYKKVVEYFITTYRFPHIKYHFLYKEKSISYIEFLNAHYKFKIEDLCISIFYAVPTKITLFYLVCLVCAFSVNCMHVCH